MTQPAAQQPASSTAASVVDSLAVELVTLYTTAEQALISEETQLAKTALAQPIRSDLLGRMRQVAQRIATMLHLRAWPLAMQMAELAAAEGDRVAMGQLRHRVNTDQRFALAPHGQLSANLIGIELAARLDQVNQRILRFSEDAYRAIAANAATRLVLSQDTPQTAQLLAWRRLTARGIIGFTDRTGGQWNLASYVEMAVRTAGQRAFNASHEARMTALGVDYFTVNHDGHPCPLCLPFEGRVLSRTGNDHDAINLADAEAAGLFHPNCRHVLVPYFPGVTKLGRASDWTQADENRYQATQRLRYLERQVRAGKYQEAAALTPLEAKRARAKVRAGQAAIRAHVDQNSLVRRPRREQLDLGNRIEPERKPIPMTAVEPQTITVVGGPRRGKSTLSAAYLARGIPVYCGDPLSKVKDPMQGVNYLPEGLAFAGDGGSAEWVAKNWFTMPGPWVCEGQVMARALRRWATDNPSPEAFPCDQIIVLDKARAATSSGQEAMHKGVMTVWQQIAHRFAAIVRH